MLTQITNKINISGSMAALLLASCLFVSCGEAKKTESTEAAPADTTLTPLTAPDTLPAKDSTATKRPEPRKT